MQNISDQLLISAGLFLAIVSAPMMSGCEAPKGGASLAHASILQKFGSDEFAQANCDEDDYDQPDSDTKNRVDLLIVTDTEENDYQRKEFADYLPDFMAGLSKNVDLQIAVMLGQGPGSDYEGKLFHHSVWTSSPGAVLSNKTMSANTIHDRLVDDLYWLPDDHKSDGGRMFFTSLMKGLSSDSIHDSRKQGFFRANAVLMVLFLTDDIERCSRVSDAACDGVNAASVLKKLQDVQGSRPVILASITHAQPFFDAYKQRDTNSQWIGNLVQSGAGLVGDMKVLDEGQNGIGYFDLNDVDAMGGGLVKYYVQNYEDLLGRLGKFTGNLLSSINPDGIASIHNFDLGLPSIDPDSIQINFEGDECQDDDDDHHDEDFHNDSDHHDDDGHHVIDQEDAHHHVFHFDSDSKSIEVPECGRKPHCHVKITYCEPAPSPSPSPSVTPAPSPSPSVTPTPSPSPSVTPTPSPSPSVTPTPSPSPSVTPTPSPSPSVTPTPSPSPSVTPTPSPSPSVTPTPSPSPSVTPTPSPSPSVTPTPSPSPSVTPTPSPSPSVTPTPSPSPSVTPTPSPSPSPSASPCTGPGCGGGSLGT